MLRKSLLTAVWVWAAVSAGVRAAEPQAADPLAYLCGAVENDDRFVSTVMALRAVGDKELFPVFAACAQSEDKKRRLFAASALAEISPKEAAPVLTKLFEGDPSMAVRAEALVHLLELKALSVQQLAAATQSEDESVQCIAARALVQLGQPGLARPTLTKLANSKNTATASMSKMTLLLLGQSEMAGPLQAVLTDPATGEDVLALLLEQIAEEKISPARDLAIAVIKGNAAPLIKVRAYKALSAIGAAGPALGQAIGASDDLVFRVHLLHILAGRGDGGNELVRLAQKNDVVVALATFELNRKKNTTAAAAAAQTALQSGHPVVVDYVLEALRLDLKENPGATAAYVPALLELIRSVSPDVSQMQAEHFRAANAAKLLCDIGTPEALAGLRAILHGRYNAIVRATATGIYKSTNGPAACGLVRDFIHSPYDEFATDAGLTLGRNGDPAGKAFLADLVRRPTQNPPPLVALACWFSLKIDGKTAEAAVLIARHVK